MRSPLRPALALAWIVGISTSVATAAPEDRFPAAPRSPSPDVVLQGHTRPVRAINVSRDGTKLVSSADREVILWDARTGAPLHRWTDGIDDRVYDVVISGDGRRVAASDRAQVLHVWDALSGQRLHRILNFSNQNGHDEVTSDETGSRFIAGTYRGTLEVAEEGRFKRLNLGEKGGEIIGEAFTPDGQEAIFCCAQGPLKKCSLVDGAVFPFLDLGPFEGTLRLLISRDSRRGLFVGRTQSVYWSENGEKTTVSGKYEMLDYDQFDMFDALMTDDGAVVVSYRDDKLMICRLGDDASEIVNKRHGLGDVRALDVFQRDRIAFGFGDGRIEVWTIPHLAPYFEDWAAWTSKTLEPLLNEGEYFALEKQLASLRKSPTYSPDGWSQLGAAYNALAAPRDANGKPDAAARPARLAALQAWRKAVPSSIAARIALAEWHRGELESTVGKLGLDNVVERHLAAAEQALIFPNGEHDEDVHYYRLLIQLAYWGKKPREDVVGLVKAGQEIDPGEPSLYQHAFDFARRSRNDPGEGESLLREVCSDLPESAQLEIYFRTALFAVEQARRERASFPRDAIEKEGFDVARLLEATPVLRAKHPYEQPILQAAMYFAYLADDHEMRRRLGPRAGAYTYQGVAGVSGAEVLKGWARSEPIAGPSRSLRVSPAPIVQACFCDRDRGFAVVENSDRSTFREVNHVSHIGVASKLHYRSAPEASLRTLTIDQTVLTVAGDPTRPRAAVAARTQRGTEVFLVDLQTGEIGTRRPTEYFTTHLMFTADGKRLLAWGPENFSIKIAEVDESLHEFKTTKLQTAEGTRPWGSLRPTADGSGVYASEQNRESCPVNYYNCETGALRRNVLPRRHGGASAMLVLAPDQKTLWVGDNNGSVVWDLANGGAISEQARRGGWTDMGRHYWRGQVRENEMRTALAFSPSGQWLVSAPGSWFDDDFVDQRTDVLLVDVPTLSIKHRLPGHFAPAEIVKFSEDGRTVMSFGRDGYYREWDVEKLVGAADESVAPARESK